MAKSRISKLIQGSDTIKENVKMKNWPTTILSFIPQVAMTELSIHWDDFDLNTSVFFEGDGEVSITYNNAESDHNDMDVDVEEDGCGCGENQMSHYDFDGSVLADLPEKCRQYVNGPIGTGGTLVFCI